MAAMVQFQRRARSREFLAIASLSASLLAACTLTVDANRVQCRTQADCTARGSAFVNATCIDSICQLDPAWACLSEPASPSTQAPPFTISVTARDLVSQSPVSNAQIRLCRKLDVDCASPVATSVTDATGATTFMGSASDFSGYLQVAADGVVPTLYFFNPAIDRNQSVALTLASPAANFGLLLQLGQQPVPGHGNIVISSSDCTGKPAAGVVYSTPGGDDKSLPFYTVATLPTGTAHGTDGGGYGGVVNVPAGATTVTATLASSHAELGTISLLVRDGATTYSRILPIGK